MQAKAETIESNVPDKWLFASTLSRLSLNPPKSQFGALCSKRRSPDWPFTEVLKGEMVTLASASGCHATTPF
jgi:hypothetical protein